MPRRPHRKSRNGCIECKRRHIKCDEKMPVCSNCTSSDRNCEYALDSNTIDVRIHRTSSQSRTSLDPRTPDGASQNDPQELRSRPPPVNMQHVGLFYHLLTETFDSLRLEFAGVHIPFHKLFKEAVSAPYLMNELLALAAIHRSTLSPSEQTFYRDQATELQTYALSIFNATKPQINAETCVPMFLFSSVLGIHEMCETFVFRETDFELFVEKFVRYLCLHQGVKVVTRGTWHILRESVLGPLLKQGETILPTSTALGEICSRLQHLVKSANLSQEDIASCEQAISSLQSVLDAAPLDVQGRLRMNAILSWPVILSQGYTDLLRQREPHALVILAHYAAVVHSRRDMWMCGDGGAYLVKLIAQHLGEDWSDWLFWPHQAVSDSSAIITSSLEQD